VRVARAAGPARSSRWAAAPSVRSECARRPRRHLVVWLDVDPAVAWRRSGGGGDRWRASARRSSLCMPRAARFTNRLPTRSCRRRAQTLAAAHPALVALRDAPAGTRMLWAVSASASTRSGSGAGSSAPASGRSSARLRGASSSATRTSRRCGAQPLGELDGQIAIAPGEASKTLASAERVWHALVAAGSRAATTSSRSAAASSATSPASAPRPTSAASRSFRCRRRSSRRSTRPTGARPASICRRQELRRRVPPAGRGARRPGDARDAARSRAERRLRRGAQDGVDRGRHALGARRRRCGRSTSS
jgi:hypothetical protein